LTKFFCFFLFTKRRFFLQLNLLILLAIFPDGRYFMSVTSTMTESLRMVRNQENFCHWGLPDRAAVSLDPIVQKFFASFFEKEVSSFASARGRC